MAARACMRAAGLKRSPQERAAGRAKATLRAADETLRMGNLSTDLLLSIDCGTQSVRALVFDLQGELVGRRQHVFDTYVTPRDNWLEHDAEEFWRATGLVCRALFEDRPDLRARIRGVAVTTQRGSLVLVDESGAPRAYGLRSTRGLDWKAIRVPSGLQVA